jgi:hypothetical protein
MDKKIDLNKYKEFVASVTSEQSNDMGQVSYADPNIGLHEWGFTLIVGTYLYRA